jgi:predicted TIM-barrel fold metal-dependent hydrolase
MGPKVGLWQWALGVSMPLVAALVFTFLSTTATGGGKLSRIDTHAHMIPPFYRQILDARGIMAGGKPTPDWSPEGHIAVMDSMKIELSILSVSSPGAKLSPSDSIEDGRKLARDLNDYAHMVTMRYPGRFQFFATLTLPDVEGAVAEAIYALDTLNAAGVEIFGNSQGEYLGTKRFDPLLEVLNERSATVFIHPSHIDALPGICIWISTYSLSKDCCRNLPYLRSVANFYKAKMCYELC